MKIFEQNFIRYLNASFPIVYVDTLEDDKAKHIIHDICKQTQRGVIEWSLSEAKDYSVEPSLSIPLADLPSTLKLLIKNNLDNKILILQDAHFFLSEPKTISALKSVAQKIISGEYNFNICIISPLVSLPKELENYTTIMELDTLTGDDIKEIIVSFTEMQGIDPPEKDLLDKLITRFKGLSQTEIDNILALAISEDGMLTYSDLPLVLQQKQQMIKKSGILEMIRLKETMDDIGGLKNLKAWLLQKAEVFKQLKISALTFPKAF